MMKLYSPGPQPPVVPVIGPNVFNLTAFLHGSRENARFDHPRAESQTDRSREVMDYFAAMFVIAALAFGPTVAWLLVQ